MVCVGKNPNTLVLCATFRIWERIRLRLTEFLCDSYRPEQHYMRGTGPKCRAKAANSALIIGER